ncbi:F0F1 ATP synthase subunit A [Blastococcus sp. BMG 814]|uniref:ATP synthase subunit a n=1 Tax=Blastococcus carthaginiensis TaxID=3050034 RepID=A0ABT9IHL7_9ACTN|nr:MULTISPECIES: F0F1 ATP synthase subunit A [Blastococcus]MDP5185078.1 F0F1 ATP synthase subunit A [Blastococcus carthaginiensis]SEK18398.1 ATP synthase F0 subcomplex A subunit [Blastococcus sp. DSM 46786]
MTTVVSAAEEFVPPSAPDFWQPLVGDGAFAITRSMIVMVLVTIGLAVVMMLATRRLSVVPGRGQYRLEGVYGLVRNSIGRDIIGSDHFRPYVPLLFTLFTLILLNNLMAIIPVVQFPTTSRISFPIAFALGVYVVYLVAGVRRRGLGGFLKNLVPSGLPFWVVPVVFILELVTFLITRPVTLALRLFGNMFAGHILLLLFAVGGEFLLLNGDGLLKLVSIPAFFMFFLFSAFEILIAFLQAYVFILLASVYIAEVYADDH